MREEIHRRIDTMAKCILLHGLGEKTSDWSDTVKYIDRNFEVSCPALFEWLQGTEFCYTNLYQGLENYCRQFEEPFILGGFSLGGILALQYAIEHGGKVDSLILMGTQFSMPVKLLKFQNFIFRLLPNRTFREMGASRKEIIGLCNSMINLDFTEKLKDIHCRTLILCGGNDRANYAASMKLKEQIPDSELCILADVGHEMNRGHQNMVGELINSFLLR